MAHYFKFRTCEEKNYKSLEQNQIYASKIHFFNDPFETVCWENENPTVAERVHYDSLQSHLNTRFGNRAFHCVSYSEDDEFVCDNLLMWAHYTSGHKGFCIAYNGHLLDGLEENKLSDGYCRVEYRDELPDLPEDGNNLAFLNVIKTKSKVWVYEHELRMIYRGDGLKQLDDNVVDAIYLGCKISDSDKQILMGIAKRLGVKCYQMKINSITNRLEKEKVDLSKVVV